MWICFKPTPRKKLYFLNPPIESEEIKPAEIKVVKTKKKKAEEVEIGFSSEFFYVKKGRSCKFFDKEVARRIAKEYGCLDILDYNLIVITKNGKSIIYDLDKFFARYSK